jgi:Tudor domain
LLQIWKNYVEEEKQVEEEKDGREGEEEKAPAERKKEYTSVFVTEVTDDLRFYAQKEDQGSKLVALMDELTQAFTANPPLGGAYVPKKGSHLMINF